MLQILKTKVWNRGSIVANSLNTLRMVHIKKKKKRKNLKLNKIKLCSVQTWGLAALEGHRPGASGTQFTQKSLSSAPSLRVGDREGPEPHSLLSISLSSWSRASSSGEASELLTAGKGEGQQSQTDVSLSLWLLFLFHC